MLKKTITYTDYDGVERKEDFYFNLSEAEIAEMQLTTDGGLDTKLQRIVDSKNVSEIIKVFKEILLKSYGEKSDDGKHFIKKRNGVLLAEEFEQTEAYSKLYMELATDDKAASAFISSVLPKKYSTPEQTPATIAAIY